MRAMAAAPENVENPLLTGFCGMQLNSPIVLLSCCVGFGADYTRDE
jgi:dihydroorotate dehydrogenase (NAD+) catalytic subunit